MSETKTNDRMEKIVSLCKRRGFIFQSSEIYGGINGFWDYGPLGAELKRNVKELWWQSMTRLREDVVGLEATIIMHPQIWRASGHVETFSDPMCDCLLTKKRFRADQVELQSGQVYYFAGAVDGDSFLKLQLEAPQDPAAVQAWAEVGSSYQWKPGERDVRAQQSLWPVQPIASVGSPEANRKAHAAPVNKALQSLAHSGHLAAFRADEFAVLVPDGKPFEKGLKVAREFYQQRGVKNPIVLVVDQEAIKDSQRFNPENGALLTPPVPYNLMFKTYVGPTATEADIAYLRPETAQAIFAQFKNVLETCRQKLPFGIAQMGKAFRNEVTPRNFTFRSREFEQMELEFFIKPDEVVEATGGAVAQPGGGHPGEPQPNWGWQTWHKYWVEERIRFYEGIGLPRATLEEYWQKPEELAHYARATVDLLFKFPFGTQELEGIAARGDFDLSQHKRFSGKPMGVFDEELRTAWGKLDEAKKQGLWQRYHDARFSYLTKVGVLAEQAAKEAREDADGLAKGQYIPHVIEPSAGVDRLLLALITNAYDEVTETDDKGKSETRVVMRFHPRVAPVKAAIFPLLKNKPELVKKALEVRDLLRPHMNAFYDDTGSIGRRYARQDEAGTPFGITIDFDTLGETPALKDTVTLRDRDTMQQARVPISELLARLLERVR